MLILITGGSGSGKSKMAERLCLRLDCQPLYYIATMKIWDEECAARVQRHRAQRAGMGFCTMEAPCCLGEKTAHLRGGCGLLECIGNLVAGEMYDCNNPCAADTIVYDVQGLAKRLTHLVVVTNEVFTDGMVSEGSMRDYLRQMGQVNCRLAKEADMVLEVTAGILEIWKGEKLYAEIMG